MKSFCIKTNNQELINYLLKKLEASSLENIYFISKEFKCYKNVIVHYLGKNISQFLINLSDILTEALLLFYEPILLQRLINIHYFYFDEYEKKIIENNCFQFIVLDEDNMSKYRKEEIWVRILLYINSNKSMILDGFVNFRLKNYVKSLEEIVDYSVQQYIIEKEYNDFINLLKLYIDSKAPELPFVNLIYLNGESILLNENKKYIDLGNNIFNAKYLSDISFSSNDYALNALLTLLPKKIEIHLVSNYEDEFINTLKLIFGKRISICKSCSLCNAYRILNNAH